MEKLSIYQALQVKGRVEADTDFNSVQVYTVYDKYEKEFNKLYNKLCTVDAHGVSDYIKYIMSDESVDVLKKDGEIFWQCIKALVTLYKEDLI